MEHLKEQLVHSNSSRQPRDIFFRYSDHLHLPRITHRQGPDMKWNENWCQWLIFFTSQTAGQFCHLTFTLSTLVSFFSLYLDYHLKLISFSDEMWQHYLTEKQQLMWCRLYVKVFIFGLWQSWIFRSFFQWFKIFNEESLNRQSSMSWRHINCSMINSWAEHHWWEWVIC